jgi:hypothetical protein
VTPATLAEAGHHDLNRISFGGIDFGQPPRSDRPWT